MLVNRHDVKHTKRKGLSREVCIEIRSVNAMFIAVVCVIFSLSSYHDLRTVYMTDKSLYDGDDFILRVLLG